MVLILLVLIRLSSTRAQTTPIRRSRSSGDPHPEARIPEAGILEAGILEAGILDT